jgi:hypothetical protein
MSPIKNLITEQFTRWRVFDSSNKEGETALLQFWTLELIQGTQNHDPGHVLASIGGILKTLKQNFITHHHDRHLSILASQFRTDSGAATYPSVWVWVRRWLLGVQIPTGPVLLNVLCEDNELPWCLKVNLWPQLPKQKPIVKISPWY